MHRTLRLIARPHWVWLFAALIAAKPARAQNRGVYPLGMSAINSGVTPEPGFSYTNQLLFYVRDEAKDNDGRTLPIAGINTVVMDMNSLTWVSKQTDFRSAVCRVSHSAFREKRSDIRHRRPDQRRHRIRGFILLALNPGLEHGARRGAGDVWLPGPDRAVRAGREQQRRVGILDARPIVWTNVLSDARQAPHSLDV